MRNLNKARDEYKKILKKNKGNIYYEDYLQIVDMCKGDVYEMVMVGMEVGIAIGYRLAKREIRKERE